MKQITLTETQYLSLRHALEQALALLTGAEIAALNRPAVSGSDAGEARRAEAMRRLANGDGPWQLMKDMGIPKATAYRWAKEAGWVRPQA